MPDLMADYERMVGILKRAKVPYETNYTHDFILIYPRKKTETKLTFDSLGALKQSQSKQEG